MISSENTRVPIDDIIHTIGSRRTAPPLRNGSREDAGIKHSVERPSPLVKPSLYLMNSNGEHANVVLIGAPAAVGKSILSQYIASETGAVLWDLSAFRMASNFFTGTITKAYGGGGFAFFEEALSNGTATLILDAADEALVKVGLASYEAALDDLTGFLSKTPNDNPSIIVFARPETVTLTAVKFEEAGVPWQLWGISLFDRESSIDLVHQRWLHAKDASSTEVDFHTYINIVFPAIERAFAPRYDWSADELRSFLGYAPILDALGNIIGEQNTHGLVSLLDGPDGKRHLWTFFSQIVRKVLEREQSKFQRSTDSTAHEAAIVFGPEEQLTLLFSEKPLEADLIIPDGVTDERKRSLIESARSQLSEHPFLRDGSALHDFRQPLLRFANLAFRDYVGAWALHRGGSYSTAAVTYFANPDVNPSPFLIRFVLVAEEDWSNTGVRHDSLGCLVDSASTSLGGAVLRGEIYEGLDGEAIRATFDEGDVHLGTIHLRLGTGGYSLKLGRICKRISIRLPNRSLTFGSGTERDFELGPDVEILATGVTSVVDEIRVPEGNVQIDAGSIVSSTRQIVVARGASLSILSSDARYPWKSYVTGPASPIDARTARRRAGMELRGVLSWFLQESMTGRLSYPVGAMKAIRAKDRIPNTMFEYLESEGMLWSKEGIYYLDLPASVAAVRTLDLDDTELCRFLDSYNSIANR